MEPQVTPIPSLMLRPRFVLHEQVVTDIGNVLLSYFTRLYVSVFNSTQLMKLGIALREGRDYMVTVDGDIIRVHWWDASLNVVTVANPEGVVRANITRVLNDLIRTHQGWPSELMPVRTKKPVGFGVDFETAVSTRTTMSWDVARQGDPVLVTGLNDPSFPSLCVRFGDGRFLMDPQIGRYENGWLIAVSALEDLKRKAA